MKEIIIVALLVILSSVIYCNFRLQEKTDAVVAQNNEMYILIPQANEAIAQLEAKNSRLTLDALRASENAMFIDIANADTLPTEIVVDITVRDVQTDMVLYSQTLRQAD